MNVYEILRWIEYADDLEIGEVMKAIILRNRRVYPDEETLVISLPCSNAEERRRTIREMLRMINP